MASEIEVLDQKTIDRAQLEDAVGAFIANIGAVIREATDVPPMFAGMLAMLSSSPILRDPRLAEAVTEELWQRLA